VTQVFGILLDNALRYTQAGGQVAVGARAETRAADAEHAEGSGGVLARLRHPAPPTPAPASANGNGLDASHAALADGEHSPVAPPTASGPGVRFWVADNGPGIGPDDLPHVFERFYRADPSRARRSGGSGLGLAIARRYVEAHGGLIWAQSPSALAGAAPGGRGTTIAFWLPAAAADDGLAAPDVPAGIRHAEDSADGAGRVPVLRAWARLARP
jgi:signal transduction histidine kinase